MVPGFGVAWRLANSTVRSVIYIALRYKSMDDHAQKQQENLSTGSLPE
jgi:hypothetical protein